MTVYAQFSSIDTVPTDLYRDPETNIADHPVNGKVAIISEYSDHYERYGGEKQ